jgi:AbrB family looped-hinge helix DNA binding protein
MSELTATVDMDSRGRVVIPKPVRKSLGIDGDSATLEIDVEVVE